MNGGTFTHPASLLPERHFTKKARQNMGQNSYDSNRVHGFLREFNHGRNLGLAICLVPDECFEACRIAQSHWWVRFSPNS